ncbi:MMPL family transporter [Planctomicrobium sp. SH664]|uniref:MMPL family transporter n=1 Tax=Planctomicrobium sp. SH664 TaxID=3448125 RepID=UPI003F5C4175
MFRPLGHLISRYWYLVILAWIVALIALAKWTPTLESVVEPGEFKFLPDESPTRQGEALFERAFPNDLLGSSVVIVVYRDDGQPLNSDDSTFIEDKLRPRLESLMANPDQEAAENIAENPDVREEAISKGGVTFPEIVRVRSPASKEIGKLLTSADKKGALVIVDLKADFMASATRKPTNAIQGVVEELKSDGQIPAGLHVALSGSAVVGRDVGEALSRSAHNVEVWTLILIVTLLLLVYRAPLPVIVPLATLFVAMRVAMRLLALAAKWKWIHLFEGIEVYTMVVAYGAGVDFSMFLTSRFHEEIRRTKSVEEALTRTLQHVGPAIAAAAGTVIFGIGMMVFAEFGKFHQAGISIPFAIFVILIAALTFTPALLRLMGRWTFWPEVPSFGQPELPSVGLFSRVVRFVTMHSASTRFWESLATAVTVHPVRSWIIAVACMMPFTVVGVYCYDHVNYGLVNQLSTRAASVSGTRDIARNFSPGLTGPVTAMIENTSLDFSKSEGQKLIEELKETLAARKDELHITDIRSVSNPLGLYHQLETTSGGGRPFNRILRKGAGLASTREYYIGEKTETGAHITRLDIILDSDPFARESVTTLNALEEAVRKALPEQLRNGGKVFFIGSTASIRDLQKIAAIDRVRINALVCAAVFVVLILLIRSIKDSIYLMASVIFSFLCTLGITYLLFAALEPETFPGLDWTVPLFLFTILVAVGQDYNIFLITRVHEEREHHGPLGSIKHAIIQTAGIITSCGLIMAGTFSALAIGGELARMNQLGFALAFGVLLDTLVVRPILVPAYLAWRAKRQLLRAGLDANNTD